MANLFHILLCIIQPLYALNNGLALTPPMGWRSWNCYHIGVTDSVIRATIDAVVAKARKVDGVPTSLQDLGFNSVGIDDGWQACGTGHKKSFHASDGTPLVNKTKFPDLHALVSYAHSKNVKIGWYDNNCYCMDEYTLRDDPTWAEKAYAADAMQALDAGFDELKIDNCGDDDGSGFVSRFKHINTTRPIVIENSDQGHGHGPPRGLPTDQDWCPFNFFRTDGDIGPDFGNVISKLQYTIPFQNLTAPISRPGCWAYPDMLEVGNIRGSLAVTESRTHFGAWCVVSSPLILGLDLLDKSRVDSIWEIISNKEAIAVNQAWAGHPGRLVRDGGTWQIWAKLLPKGDQAVLVFNRSNKPVDISIKLKDLDLPQKCTARDIWSRSDVGTINDTWNIKSLKEHDSMFYHFTSA